MKVLPKTLRPFSRTKTFAHDSVPKKLLQNHDTRAGIWAVLNVENGEIQYTIEDNEVVILSKNVPGVIEPTVTYHIKPLGKASFYIEFYK